MSYHKAIKDWLSKMPKAHYCVDLDGTLAHYDGWINELHIGAPIPKMVRRIKAWLKDGLGVKIFTARMSSANPEVEKAIRAWTLEHIGTELEPTCSKDYSTIEIWDDRAVQVRPNTGERITCPKRKKTKVS